ncbi:MAG: VWA domain-containing protein [Rhodospirillales bacterium]
MFTSFFYELRDARLPVSLKEYLTLLGAMEKGVADYSIDHFYYLARATLVKDERHLDRFDLVFAKVFEGVLSTLEAIDAEIPEEWLKKLAEKFLTEEEKAKVESLGGWDKLMETLKERLAEQQKRHQGGSKWIGTAGTSPFGAYGYNPEGIRIGQDGNRNFRAVKVWDKREFRNLDDGVEIGTRNIKVALRRLRRFARQGVETELDLDDTIRSTAAKGGMLDIKMAAERRNTVKVLLLMDIGGSMDGHVKRCEELFSAARSEFKHLAFTYFHNCVYESVWTDNNRRRVESIPTDELIRTYGPDWKLVFVGDASMSPYEIEYPGGSVEHWNEEPGRQWVQRLLNHFPHHVWLNPVPEKVWHYTHSIRILSEMLEGRMYPLTIEGLDGAMRELNR